MQERGRQIAAHPLAKAQLSDGRVEQRGKIEQGDQLVAQFLVVGPTTTWRVETCCNSTSQPLRIEEGGSDWAVDSVEDLRT